MTDRQRRARIILLVGGPIVAVLGWVAIGRPWYAWP